MLQDLGIGYIAAHSPQAKGRIERLWATLQDRLVSELRLRRIATVAAAEAYVPAFIADFNRRFGKPPAAPTAVWRRPPRTLPLLLSCRYWRVVARDNTVRLGPRWLQLPPRRALAGRAVEVRELLDGTLVVLHDGAVLATQPAPGPAFILKPRQGPGVAPRAAVPRHAPRPRPASPPRPGSRPRASHPWRHAIAQDIRRHLAKKGRTFSRSSQGGHSH